MMGSRSRGLFMAGIVGAMVGMYLMNMLDQNEGQVRAVRRRVMRGAKQRASRLEQAYESGKHAVQAGISSFRH